MKKRPRRRSSAGNTVIITGVSGAGKTLALKFLQDMDYFCIDNLPVKMMESLFGDSQFASRQLAVGVDIREKEHFKLFIKILEKRRRLKLIFLESRPDVLVGRFMENRRRPPFARSGESILSALEDELKCLAPLRAEADLIIDTSCLNPWQLKDSIRKKLGFSSSPFALVLQSFGYKYGLPPEADMIYDLRYLPNPNYQPRLRSLTGRSAAIVSFLGKEPLYARTLRAVTDFLKLIIPAYMKTGKAFLTVGIGCTGGRHRSVAFASELKKNLSGECDVRIFHRDAGRRLW